MGILKIEEIIKKLPPEFQKEVEDFIQFLLEKHKKKTGKKLKQEWAGALKKYRKQFTSLELQKKSLEWREDQLIYLVDTNIWLERLLEQTKYKDVEIFLNKFSSDSLFVTDFSFHSICLIMIKLGEAKSLLKFVKNVFIDAGVNLIHLLPEDIVRIVQITKEFKLDFDDAYQYVSAEKYNLTIVSFDSDFDKTPKGRKTPAEIVKR